MLTRPAIPASRATPAEIAEIAAAYERMAAAAGDREAYYAADLAFHMAIFSACHNELISQLNGIVATVIEASFRLQSRSVIEPRASLGLHQAVLRQITRRSILDWMTGEVERVRKQLGAADRARLERYLDNVRELERRIQAVVVFNHCRAVEPEHTGPDDRCEMCINSECHGQNAGRFEL